MLARPASLLPDHYHGSVMIGLGDCSLSWPSSWFICQFVARDLFGMILATSRPIPTS